MGPAPSCSWVSCSCLVESPSIIINMPLAPLVHSNPFHTHFYDQQGQQKPCQSSWLARSCRLSTPISTAPTRSWSTGTNAPSPARRRPRSQRGRRRPKRRSRWRRKGRANPGAQVDLNFDSRPLLLYLILINYVCVDDSDSVNPGLINHGLLITGVPPIVTLWYLNCITPTKQPSGLLIRGWH